MKNVVKSCLPITILAVLLVFGLSIRWMLPFSFRRKIGIDYSTGRLTKAYFVCGTKVYEEPFYFREIVDGVDDFTSQETSIPVTLVYVDVSNRDIPPTVQARVLFSMKKLNWMLSRIPVEERSVFRDKYLETLRENPNDAVTYVSEVEDYFLKTVVNKSLDLL